MDDYLPTCEHAARAGGQVLLDWIGRFAAREKAPADLVTEADVASQEEIRRILLTAYPKHAFLGEEGSPMGPADAEYRWLVDPLDGTTNYVHQIPHYCVSVALERQGELICGVVYDPVSQECFTAQAGRGAHRNGCKLAVSEVEQIDRAVVVVSLPPKMTPQSRELAEMLRMAVAAQAIRRTGSAALNLAYVAAGRFDAYWGGNTKPWDVAAGALLIHEAGGIITNYSGGPLDLNAPRFVAAATMPLHEQMLRLVGDKC
ncbi:MAG TPA: inositol monophosphatase family protein [Pirellulales bacterium]|jgi:myo-inositol-1(or 4)-monophosphatase|nr:inositol monophosphatase family protein [Pirellulales bacterium]